MTVVPNHLCCTLHYRNDEFNNLFVSVAMCEPDLGGLQGYREDDQPDNTEHAELPGEGLRENS